MWLAGLLAVILALTVAVIVTNSGEEPARDTTGTQTEMSGTAPNTPSEVRAHIPRRAANTGSTSVTISGTIGNTPSELSGGLQSPALTDETLSPMERNKSAIERYARHQLG